MNDQTVKAMDRADILIIGAGLAGCEAAWQISLTGASVALVDMKPQKFSAAHSSGDFAELVCSNSLGASSRDKAKGLLKQELREMGSLIMECADETAIPAGGALAVDRGRFARLVTERIMGNRLISVSCGEARDIPDAPFCVIATGPLSSDPLAEAIGRRLGSGNLYFFDAAAPVVTRQSIDGAKTFMASRYGSGGDYINCPMDRLLYEHFTDELLRAETAHVKGFDERMLFEGCMPVESMARRGFDSLRFGPLRPKGLRDPATGREPYAVAQLRQDNAEGTLYNLVGFQTRLLFGEQRRVFGMLPGLENAEFVRYGVMHRNTFINSPAILDARYAVRRGAAPCGETRETPGGAAPNGAGARQGAAESGSLYFAGQITGVEGYLESASSGLTAGVNIARDASGKGAVLFPPETMIGALARYVSSYAGLDFQPMGANFGILAPLRQADIEKHAGGGPGMAEEPGKRLSKKERLRATSERALGAIRQIAASIGRPAAP